ncbi:hypothetical protein Bca4012_082216 [Brassica carinata]
MACVADESQIEIDIHDHVESPSRYVFSATSSSSSCNVAVGSHSLMSKKVKARKLPMVERFEVEGSANSDCCRPDGCKTRRPEIVRVYCRRRKRSPQRGSLVAGGNAESLKLDEKNQKKRRIGEGSSSVRSFTGGSGLRSCSVNGAVSGNKQNVSSRRKGSSVRNQDKVSLASGSTKRWVRLSYDGSIAEYSLERKRHIVKYEDGSSEDLFLDREMIRFFVSREELEMLHLKICTNDVTVGVRDYDEMVVLAANLEDSQDFGPGDIVWAKLSGHAMWPAVIVDESVIGERKGLSNKVSGGRSILVQFFGTHDFARIKVKQATSFLKGLLSPSSHLKCKQPRYLKEHRIPERMTQLQKGADSEDSAKTNSTEEGSSNSAGDHINDGEVWLRPTEPVDFRYTIGDLQIINLGKIVTDSQFFKDENHIWPEGYTAMRKFTSLKVINGLSKSRLSSNVSISKHSLGRHQDHLTGYRPVRVDWKDLDKCNVCHMDEEYENNLFLQCDKCRIMVHAGCYGELEPCDGALWLCNLCRPGAPDIHPRCCLCPVVGGVMKPTTDGRWAHLACAIWIPETCLSDVKKMEPIDRVKKISKDRWKLMCTICGVSYGACIQCSNDSCRVAYHPLCARASGLCVELESEDKLFLLPKEDEEADQCILMRSFCKRHRQTSTACLESKDMIKPTTHNTSDYLPPPNPSGCARTEPYSFLGRRGRKEPEALAAASSKRLFVENQPYLIGGFSRNEVSAYECIHGSKVSQMNTPTNIVSMAEKYKYMKETYKKRLTFGKSGIHGFGIFGKLPHRAGDMVIEYTGELVRPSIADKRERLIYNSMVGAGTYMFRIDDERVIDATRAGSIAHLINHSCVPNCYSRVISVNGDEHIIIFAKRDIAKWEELTYDYRFFSVDERLSCSCGFPGCRGVVNDTVAEEQLSKICVPRSDLIDWTGE